jgi:hypothetical protein
MEKSYFIEYIKTFFKGIVLSVVKKLNGKEDGMPPRYRFKEMLRQKFSVTGKWESLYGDYRNVKADVVAMDSPLPIKKRPSMGSASGDIPKSGMKKWLNETQMTNLQTLAAIGENDEIKSELFKDAVSCITGIYENNEYLFLYGLSTGIALTTDAENIGTGVRLDYGYKNENKFGVTVDWSNTSTATPIDDLERMFEKANGNIRILMLDRPTLKKLCATYQMREQYAFFKDMNVSDGARVPALTLDKLNEFMGSEYKVTFDVVERTVISEKNGVDTILTPWQEGMIIGIQSYVVGDLVYAKTAEQNAPVAGVEYQIVDSYALLSMYRKNEPAVSEYTQIQARVFPVISNVNKIYQLDTKKIQA